MHLYIPKPKKVIPVTVSCKQQGFIGWQVRKKDGRVKRAVDPYPNVITNQGLNGLATARGQNLFRTCAVGTGSSTPSTTDTTLDNQVGYEGGSTMGAYSFNATDAPYWGQIRARYSFGEGVAEGNLTELGFFDVGQDVMWARQLFRDENGDPTTVTVLSDEFLIVDYYVRVYSEVDFVDSGVSIGGSSYDLTYRPMRVDEHENNIWSSNFRPSQGVMGLSSNALGSPTGSLPGNTDADTVNEAAYSADSFQRSVECVWDPGTFTGDINRITLPGSSDVNSNTASYQAGVSSSIPVTADDRVVLEFMFSWGRYTP